jgi:tRNA-2-methylthio-N6-dimethylallyladenosine synthase
MHLPVQSGSTRVLAAMRRRHSRDEYLDLVARIREAIPDATLSTDMIVGFPGETVEDFEQTLSLVAAVRYHSMFSFKYSPRPNTLASKRMPDDVTADEKTRRIVALQSLQREIQTRLHERMVGTTVDVLVDTATRRRPRAGNQDEAQVSGRTTGNTVVNFPVPPGRRSADGWTGRTVPVTIRRAGPNSVWGEADGAAAGIDPA